MDWKLARLQRTWVTRERLKNTWMQDRRGEREREEKYICAQKRWDNPWYKGHDACLVKRDPNLKFSINRDSTVKYHLLFQSFFSLSKGQTHTDDNHTKVVCPHHHSCTCHWKKVGKWSHFLWKWKKKVIRARWDGRPLSNSSFLCLYFSCFPTSIVPQIGFF